MEDLDDCIPSSPFEPLFIKEEEAHSDGAPMEKRECNPAQAGLTFTGTPQSALIKPYLQEMDDLLKSCEELTGIPFTSRFTPSYNETSLSESTHCSKEEEDGMDSHGEISISPQAGYIGGYIDTHMDQAGMDDQQAKEELDTSEASCQREMPLTSAGHKLSDTMVKYEGQLLGMLAMLENCMEESGMDFENQDWATDGSQEYVHISKSPHSCRGTEVMPIHQGRSVKMETQTEYRAGQHADEVSKESGATARSGSQQKPELSYDNSSSSSMNDLDPQFRFPEPSVQLDYTESNPLMTGYISTNEDTHMKGEGTRIEVDDTELPAEEGWESKMDTAESGMNDLGALGSKMEEYITEVEQLEKRRKELLAEVLQLRGAEDREEAAGGDEEEPVDLKVAELINALKREEEGRREERKREIRSLREERAEEEKRLWKVDLERQGLQVELRRLKRRLFTMARDCAQNQFALNTQHHEVELLKREEEKLKSLVLQLTEEASGLRTAQQKQLLDLQTELHAQTSCQTPNTQEELTQYRRLSCGDFQQYLQGGLKALEDRYEPILLVLLKRREGITAALVKAKEKAQELRAQLGPLREEIQKLKLQRACLEEKLKLIHLQRRDDAGLYKETVFYLEESSRELKTELNIQKRKTKEMAELRDGLTKQLLLYRAAIEDHSRCDMNEKT